MDSFKKKLQHRQLLLCGGFLGAGSLVLLTRNFKKTAAAAAHLPDSIGGFQTGVLIALLRTLLLLFVRNILAMRSAEQLKKLYISETDERKLLILQKSSSIGMNIALYGLALGTITAGNINDTVFCTLPSACLFIALVRGALKLYYRYKY